MMDNTNFDREAFKAQKKQEKDALFEQLSEATQQMIDPEKLQEYADIQGRFLGCSVSNALLIQKQRPDASWLRSFDDWKNDKVFVNRGEKGILMLKTVNYQRSDGTEGIGSNVIKQFDISQTSASDRAINRKPYQEMQGMPTESELLAAVRERAVQTFTRDTNFRGRAVSLADLAVYIMAKHYRLDTPQVDFSRVAYGFGSRPEKDVRKDLSAIRKIVSDVNREVQARAKEIRENER